MTALAQKDSFRYKSLKLHLIHNEKKCYLTASHTYSRIYLHLITFCTIHRKHHKSPLLNTKIKLLKQPLDVRKDAFIRPKSSFHKEHITFF